MTRNIAGKVRISGIQEGENCGRHSLADIRPAARGLRRAWKLRRRRGEGRFRALAAARYAKFAGSDLRTIQEILGHEDVTTTEIYLHVATGVHGLGVVSPLDQIGGPSPTFLTGPPAEVLDAA